MTKKCSLKAEKLPSRIPHLRRATSPHPQKKISEEEEKVEQETPKSTQNWNIELKKDRKYMTRALESTEEEE